MVIGLSRDGRSAFTLSQRILVPVQPRKFCERGKTLVSESHYHRGGKNYESGAATKSMSWLETDLEPEERRCCIVTRSEREDKRARMQITS